MMKKKSSLTKFMKSTITRLKEEGRFTTAHLYQSALNSFTQFSGNGELFFGVLTRVRIKQYETYLRDCKRSWNTVGTYMRILRATYNRAAYEGLVPQNALLFRLVCTGIEAQTKRALTGKEMGFLLYPPGEVELSASMQKCQRWALLMFYFNGMPFVDLANLRISDLKNGMIQCHRQKSERRLEVVVCPEAMKLIDYCRSTSPESPYLLNILNPSLKGEEAYRNYQLILGKFNDDFNKLAKILGIHQPVSSYTLRHTWATLAKFCHIPIEQISESLGHSSLKMTETYLKRFESKEQLKVNRKIITYIKKETNKANTKHNSL